ncbi:hypothetical protein F5B20DRAFT_519073 [Whalleya microplaca]|nr:hypothetical protein F5B20DRAFT_519073 [Whalleya microplaca]
MTHPAEVVATPGQPSYLLGRELYKDIKKLHKTGAVYLNDSQLAGLKVKCAGLDLNTGTPMDRGPRFLQLASPDEIETFAKENNLFEEGVALYREDYDKGPIHESRWIMEFYHWWFTPLKEDVPFLQGGPWIFGDSLDSNEGWDVDVNSSWACHFSLRVKDKTKPDIIIYLIHNSPMEDDKFFVAELLCIIRHSYSNVKKLSYHDIAPVTLITGSWRNVRIVQGYVDGINGNIVMRKSETIRLTKDMETNFKGILQIARWLLATPFKESTVA